MPQFHDDLVSAGAHGGKKAAKMLEESVNIYVHELLADLPDSTKVVARFYANVEGLAETCCKAGIVTSPQVKKDFVKGFTQGRTLFDFVDVGSGKDRADEKIIGESVEGCATAITRCRHKAFGQLSSKVARKLEHSTSPRSRLILNRDFQATCS